MTNDGQTLETVRNFIFRGFKITADGDCSHEINRHLMTNLDSKHIKKQRHYFADKGQYSQSYAFPSSHVWMWELDHEEGWVTENWCFWTVVLEKTLESPLYCKKIKSVDPKDNHTQIFIGAIDAEAEAPVLWLPDMKSWLIRKDLYAGKAEGREGDESGWDGWMTSLTQWIWISANSWRW